MIIVRISNGLGNQMFQYALGRSLAIKNQDELVLDLSGFSEQKTTDAFRSYTLAHFNVDGRIATKEDFKKIGVTDPNDRRAVAKILRKVRKFYDSRKPFSKRKIIVEPSHIFIPDALNVNGDAYLIGVWQSEKYFKDAENIIRKDFALKEPLSKDGKALQSLITSSEAIAMHIRRGDQVSDPHLAKKHGVLKEDYYQSAAELIKKKVSKPHFFIFTDDADWTKENIRLGTNVTYVSDYKLKDYEELILMSFCKHAIIAKSSFSWWGAWLNNNPEKIIITPKNRFGSAEMHDGDLIPESWIRV